MNIENKLKEVNLRKLKNVNMRTANVVLSSSF